MIRYNKEFNREIARTVRNYNAKVARLEAKGIQTNMERVRVRELKQDFQSRRDLVARINEMRKFSQRGVERIAFVDSYKTPFTEYELQLARSRQQRAIRMAEAKLEEARKIIRTTRGAHELESLMGTDYTNHLTANLEVLRQQKFSRKLPQSQQAKILRAEKVILGVESTARKAQTNFWEILKKEADYCDMPSKASSIQSVLENLNARQWELCRNGEEIIVALMENYERMSYAKSKEEKEALREDLGRLINALDASKQAIFDEYSQY